MRYHGFDADPGDVKLYIYTNVDDEGFKLVDSVDYNNDESGWNRHSLALPTGKNNVIIAFAANAVDASASILIDQLSVSEAKEHDISAENISLDKHVNHGDTTTATVRIINKGQNTEQNVEVVLLRDGVPFASDNVASIVKDMQCEVTFNIPTGVADMGKTYEWRAVSNLSTDEYAANDTTQLVSMTVSGSLAPTVPNLVGNVVGNKVSLAWTEPESQVMPATLTDGFDDYSEFIIDGIGNWKVYDGDGTQSIYFNGPDIPHRFEPIAWQVWNPLDAGFDPSKSQFQVLQPHSGSQYLACWAATDGVSQTLTNDDWLISPKVVSGSDLEFYLRVPNEDSGAQVIEILTSSSPGFDMDAISDDFTVLDRDSVYGTTDWVEFNYTLPDDANYFAIRCCTYESHTVLFLDDITFTPADSTTTNLTFGGYNVYRDGVKIATTNNLSYVDESPGTVNPVYFVTANWLECESAPSNNYVADLTTGILSTEVSNTGRAYGGNRVIYIRNAAGKTVKAYTANGQLVCDRDNVDNLDVPVAPGLYIVQMGNASVKVMVK